MKTTREGVGVFGAEWLGGSLRSMAALSRGAQAMANEASDYARSSLGAGGEATEKMLEAGDVEKAFEIQMDYVRSSYTELVAQAARFGVLCADTAKEVCLPYESIVARPK